MRGRCASLSVVRPDAVIVIHHRAAGPLRRCLGDLARHAAELPVLLLRTAPPSGPDAVTDDEARRLHPRLTVRGVPNRSYAHAVNEALRTTPGERLAILNDDVRIGPDLLPSLCAPLHDPRVAVVGPLLRTPDGRIQDQGPLHRLAVRPLVGAGPHATVPVPWVAGCAFVARRSAALAVGGMDGSLRFFNEDLEWCLRLRAHGWRCVATGAEALHEGGASTPSAARFRIEGLRGGMQVAMRHHGPLRRAAHRAAVRLFAEAAARTGPIHDRATWRAVADRFRRGRFLDPAFGATLDDPAPDAGRPEA